MPLRRVNSGVDSPPSQEEANGRTESSPQSVSEIINVVQEPSPQRRRRSIVVVSDGEDDLEVQHVHKLSAAEIRRKRMDAARAALRKGDRAPKRPPINNALLSTYRCPICLCPPTNVSITPCGHMFCGSCLYDALSVYSRQNGFLWSDSDWLGATSGQDWSQFGYGSNLFTPSGSSGAMALANVMGMPFSGARELLNDLVQQRRMADTERARPHSPSHDIPSSRLRASNGTGKLRGQCPVCRSPINGGFLGPGKKGILGLDIRLGTPRTSPPPETSLINRSKSPNKRQRVH